MKTSTDRILTTHAGSLPRSDELVALHLARSRGEAVDAERLAETARASTRNVLQRQAACGIDIANNGEQARESFFTYVQHRMSGFGGKSRRPPFADMVRYPSWIRAKVPGYDGGVNLTAAPRAEGEVRYVNRTPLTEELAEFAALLDECGAPFAETFVTAPSPGIIAAAMEDAFYHDMDAYIDALAAALKTEYEAIHAAGHVLQIDCPDLALERQVYFREASDADFIGFVHKVVGAITAALGNIPRDAVRMHVCWGNYNGPHDSDIALSLILPELTRAGVGALMLSGANPRHAHEYKLLTRNNLPGDLIVIAGVIDTTTNYIEHPEVVAQRIEAVANAIGDPRRVMAGTDCGFDSAAGSRDVTSEIAWAKLRALADGAAVASRRLF